MGDILTGLQLHLRLNEASGAIVDSTGGASGTFNNGPWTTVPAPTNFPDQTAIVITAASSQYISVAHRAALDPTSTGWTIAFWIKTAILDASTGAIACKSRIGDPGSNDGYEVLAATGSMTHVVRPAGVNHGFVPKFNNNAWRHVACVATHAGGSISTSYYLDGAFQSTSGPTAQTLTPNTDEYWIGKRSVANANHITMAMYDHRFYSRPLAAADVTDLFAYSFGASESPRDNPRTNPRENPRVNPH
jgi:hypothetical protein